MLKALITGINGFVGTHLTEFLLREGVEIIGIGHTKLSVQRNRRGVEMFCCDIRNHSELVSIIARSKPHYIFHLAARNSAEDTFPSLRELFEVNLLGTLHLFEAIRNSGCSPKILIPISSGVYGLTKQGRRIAELNPLAPVTPYGVSKAAQELLASQYVHAGLKILIARNFNIVGPGQQESFVCSSFAKQFVEIRKGLRKADNISVGNLQNRRDFCDVRDVVRAYWLLMNNGEPGEAYNICSGKGYSVQDILDTLMKITQINGKITVDPTRVRKFEIRSQVGSYAKLRRHTGWRPEISIEGSLRDLVEYWETWFVLNSRVNKSSEILTSGTHPIPLQ